MLQPNRRKFRKEQRGPQRRSGDSWYQGLPFGEWGLKATGRGRLTARQIEAARRAMTRHIKRGGRIWIRIFPDKPISKSRPKFVWVTVRATRNTGSPRSSRARSSTKWMGVNEALAREAFVRSAAAKLPISTTFVTRHLG